MTGEERPREQRPAPTGELDEELRLTLAARRELDRKHEDELIAAFLEKLERVIAQRVQQEVEAQRRAARRTDPVGRLAVSLIFAIPLSAIAASIAGLPGMAVAWLGILALNVYFDRVAR